MMILRIVCWKAIQAKQSIAVKSYDMRSAFHSGSHRDLEGVSHRRAVDKGENATTRQNAAFLSTRRRESRMIVTTPQGELCMKTGTGGLMGDSNEPELFMENFYACVKNYAAWTHDAISSPLLARSPVTGRWHNASLGLFVDDIVRMVITEPDRDMQRRSDIDAELLDEAVEDGEYAQNRDKAEIAARIIPREEGLRFAKSTSIIGRVLVSIKHLGGLLTPGGSNVAEINARVKAINSSWSSLGTFWFSEAGYPSKRLMFASVVYGTTLSGMESYALKPGELKRLDKCAARKLRAMLRGDAHVEDQEGKHFKWPTLRVWRHWRMAPVALELTGRRLAWFRDLVENPERHDHFLAVLLGELAND